MAIDWKELTNNLTTDFLNEEQPVSYVRTNDGRVFKVLDEDDIYYKVDFPESDSQYMYIYKSKCVKQVKNLENLCDAFWWENERYPDPIHIPNFGLVLERIKSWKDSDKELETNSFDKITIYGSIYIKGVGWKHVCKVNKESEKCELL